MVLSSASQLVGVKIAYHSRGGAKLLYGVRRPPLPQRPTVTEVGDAPETSPLRRTGYSKRWLDPRKVTDRTRHTWGNRDPPRAFDPGQSASAQLVSGSVGGPHRCTLASDSALSPGAGVGANPFGNGVRASTATRPRGVTPQEISLVQTRSPSSPQFGCQLPTPLRCLTSHLSMSFPLLGSWCFAFLAVAVTVRCHSRSQKLLRIEGDLLTPQVIDRPPDLRLQDRVGLLRPAFLRLTLHPRPRRCERAQHQGRRFTERPLQVRVADLAATHAFHLPGALVRARHQPRVGEEVADRGESTDRVHFVEHHQTQDRAGARHGAEEPEC